MLEKETTLFKANKDEPYLRTNIPKDVSDIMDLEEGDEIKWEVDMSGVDVVITVRKNPEQGYDDQS